MNARHSRSTLLLLVTAVTIGARPAGAQNIFSAREFLSTQTFKAGRDVWIGSATAMAMGANAVYMASSFQIVGIEFRAYLWKFDLAGNEIWRREVLTAEGSFPSVLAINGSDLYLAGSIGYGRELFVRRYDEDGNQLWSRSFRVLEYGNQLGGIVADSSGVYVTASQDREGLLRKYSRSGDELWSRRLAGSSGSMAIDRDLFVAGVNDRGGFVAKYTSAGGEQWTRELTIAPPDILMPRALAADASGLYVVASSFRKAGDGIAFLPETGRDYLSRLDGDGNEVWARLVAATTPGAISVALDPQAVFVAGGSRRSLPGQCRAGHNDVYLRRYDKAGSEQWTRQFGTSGSDYPGSLAIDSTGVYISGAIRGGEQHGLVFLAKLPKSRVLSIDSRPKIANECVVNAASYAGGGVAPGEIVTIFGQNIGPPDLARFRAAAARVPTELSGTRVLLNGIAAPVIYASATQTGAIVPYAVASALSVVVQVEYQGVLSDPLTIPRKEVRPGIFTLRATEGGQGAILNEDGSLNSPENPASPGSIIALYVTGEGLTDPQAEDGVIQSAVLPKPRLPVRVSFAGPDGDGIPAEILYAGGVAGSVSGLLQVNARVPKGVMTGEAVAIYLEIGAEAADVGATIAVH